MDRRKILLFALAALLTMLACGARVFEKQHVYSLPPRPLAQVYDPHRNAILADNVWVFRPDGTFDARVLLDGELVRLSGTYAGDDVGSVFLFFLDADGDGESDYEVRLDTENDAFSYIDWQIGESETIRYWLAE